MGNLCGGAKNAPTATQNVKQDAGKLLRQNPEEATVQQPAKTVATPAQAAPTLAPPAKTTVAEKPAEIVIKPVEVAAPPVIIEKKEQQPRQQSASRENSQLDEQQAQQEQPREHREAEKQPTIAAVQVKSVEPVQIQVPEEIAPVVVVDQRQQQEPTTPVIVEVAQTPQKPDQQSTNRGVEEEKLPAELHKPEDVVDEQKDEESPMKSPRPLAAPSTPIAEAVADAAENHRDLLEEEHKVDVVDKVENQHSRGSDQEASEPDTMTAPSTQLAHPKEEQIPHADSLIVYEEVLESTPEDANVGESDVRKNNNSSGAESGDNRSQSPNHSDEERKQRQALSTSSAEPIVADERIPMLLESPEYDADIPQNQAAKPEVKSFNEEVTPETLTLQSDVNVNEVINSTSFKQQPEIEDEDNVSNDLDNDDEEQICRAQNKNSAEKEPADTANIEKDIIMDQLEKHNLTAVERSNDPDGGLETEYFLRLTNCIYLISHEYQKANQSEDLGKRRAAYKEQNWVVYGEISQEMADQKQIMHEQVLRDVCTHLGVSETDFIETHVMVSQSEHAEQLNFALKGELLMTQPDEQPADKLTEDLILQIFEEMTRESIEQQRILEDMEGEDENELIKQAVIQGAKQMDRIFFDHGIELSDFQAASRYFIETSPSFEQRLVEKEAEIMEDL